MPERSSPNHDTPHTVDTEHVIPDGPTRAVLLNRVRKSLISVKIRTADNYNDRTHNLLEQHGDEMAPDEKTLIQAQLQEISRMEGKLEKNRSPLKGIILSWDYRCLTKETYLIAKKASNRITQNEDKNRLRGVPGPQVSPAPVPIVVDPPTSNPCSPSTPRGASTFHGEIFDDVEWAALTTFQSRTTGDPVTVLEMRTRDQRTRQFFVTHEQSPPNNDITDQGGEPRLHIHDGAEASSFSASSAVWSSSSGWQCGQLIEGSSTSSVFGT